MPEVMPVRHNPICRMQSFEVYLDCVLVTQWGRNDVQKSYFPTRPVKILVLQNTNNRTTKFVLFAGSIRHGVVRTSQPRALARHQLIASDYAHNPTDAARQFARVCQGQQRQHRLAALAQLELADCQGRKTTCCSCVIQTASRCVNGCCKVSNKPWDFIRSDHYFYRMGGGHKHDHKV